MLEMVKRKDEERRKKVRVHFRTQIIVEADTAKISMDGSSRDLSLNGIFINTDQKMPVNTPCKVKVLLSGMSPPLFLEMDGKVVRSDTSGIAVVFESMDIDSYTHLKNIVRYNVTNPDDVV
ncbi:MAG: PilZ domain-containing protein [Deltaproteobacteria bacterium]|nr:PilZ domain-containing protein [Deltaproteobacteria bacterium]MBW1994017.1 PilZ domain-containing protein [Deltaproteobacteria bacterium]MBW2151746.1 PilZ domain-containing protein [Deltaproteobacteria bacterium]